jgi:hypothetical protein
VITEKEVEALAVWKVSHSKTQLEMTIASKQTEAAVTTKDTRTSDVEAGVETEIPNIALRAPHHINHIADDQEARLETDVE